MFELLENTDALAYLEQLEGSTLFFHGCNAQGSMGAGVARAVKMRWPSVYKSYVEHCREQKDLDLVGTIQVLQATDSITVVNGFTQRFYGRGRAHAREEWISSCLDAVSLMTPFDHYVTVPVGCGLGGLNWEQVSILFAESDIFWEVCCL